MSRLQNGYFVADDGEVFVIQNGSMYPVEGTSLLGDLKPGYYDTDLNPVPEAEAVGEELV